MPNPWPLFVNVRDLLPGDVIALDTSDVFLVESIGPAVRTVRGTTRGVPSSWSEEQRVSGVRLLRSWDFLHASVEGLSPQGLAVSVLQDAMPEVDVGLCPAVHLLLLRRGQTRESIRTVQT